MNSPKLIAVTFSVLIGLASCGNGLCAIAAETQPGNSGQKFGDGSGKQADCNNSAKYDFYELEYYDFYEVNS